MSIQALYVQISPNHLRIREVTSGKTSQAHASDPFSTSRILIGNFTLAQQTLAPLVASVAPSRLRSRFFLMHPMAMTDGGLSPVEERLFTELAEACGARRVVLWLGPPLTDADVSSRLQQ